jgi:hypothetical protein
MKIIWICQEYLKDKNSQTSSTKVITFWSIKEPFNSWSILWLHQALLCWPDTGSDVHKSHCTSSNSVQSNQMHLILAALWASCCRRQQKQTVNSSDWTCWTNDLHSTICVSTLWYWYFCSLSVKDMFRVTSDFYKLYRQCIAMMISVIHEIQHCCFWQIIIFFFFCWRI